MNDRQINALAAFVAEGRPDWQPPGIVVALRARRDEDPWQVAVAMIRRAANPANETPRLQPHDFDDRPVGCRRHPWAGVRTDGTCGACFSERNAGDGQIAPRRGYGDAPARARELFQATREAS